MCRLLGISSNEPADFRIVLHDAPRSLAKLSREHRDGWGIAVFAHEDGVWRIDKGIECAGEDERFRRIAIGSRGETLVSHVRQRTVGEMSLANTHPFARGRWVFAHNGTVTDVAWLRAQTSRKRLSEIGGETDSELLFSWLLSRLDEAGTADGPATLATDRVVSDAVLTARARPAFGSFNFLLSDGDATYAHRFGRTMFLLERGPLDSVYTRRVSRDGVAVETPWSVRRSAVFVASERITDEPWHAVDDGMLLRIDRTPMPRWRLIATPAVLSA